MDSVELGRQERQTGAQERGEARTEPPAAFEDRPGARAVEELARRRSAGGAARRGSGEGAAASAVLTPACGWATTRRRRAGCADGGWRLEAR